MPVYACYRGDCDHLALSASHAAIIVPDAFGNDWLCVDTGLTEITAGFPPAVVSEMMKAQEMAHRAGLSVEGSATRLVDCPEEAGLRRWMVLNSYPPARESEERLARAGWTDARLTWGTGQPRCLTVSNGQEARTFQGETDDEIWCHAAWRVLGFPPEAMGRPAMILTVESVRVPLHPDAKGGFRVGGSRVSLDALIREYNRGADPECIARNYPSLKPADVYAVIAWYLGNKEEADRHLQARREQADQLRQKIEGDRVPGELRAKLLARKAAVEQGHAASGK